MAEQSESVFSSWTFSPEELVQARILTDLQRKYILTERAERAAAQLLMPIDPSEPMQFQLDWHRSMGFMEALTWMLNCSEFARDELRAHLQQVQQEAEAAKQFGSQSPLT